MRMKDMPPLIEAVLGRSLAAEKVSRMVEHRVIAMSREAVMVPAAMEGLEWRIVSNSGPPELAQRMGRILSVTDITAVGGEPAPDIFLAAAEPTGCKVFASLVMGVQAAFAAAMRCLGLDTTGEGGGHLAATQAVPIGSKHKVAVLRRAEVS